MPLEENAVFYGLIQNIWYLKILQVVRLTVGGGNLINSGV